MNLDKKKLRKKRIEESLRGKRGGSAIRINMLGGKEYILYNYIGYNIRETNKEEPVMVTS